MLTDQMKKDNRRRERYADKALQHYWEKVVGQGFDKKDYETQIKDMITDLLHLAYYKKLDIEYIVESAKNHFFAEITGGN